MSFYFLDPQNDDKPNPGSVSGLDTLEWRRQKTKINFEVDIDFSDQRSGHRNCCVMCNEVRSKTIYY